MKLLFDVLFLLLICYFAYKFFQVLIQMKKGLLLPTTSKELSVIRIYPDKHVRFPSYSNQKVGIIVYSIMLLYVSILFILGMTMNDFQWSYYLLVLLPFAHTHNLLNMFAISNQGILKGSRFIPWRKIKSYSFASIDYNSNFYGFSKEVNQGYELTIKTNYRTFKCMVTTDEMKERMNHILKQKISITSDNTQQIEH